MEYAIFYRCWHKCCYRTENQSCTDTWEYYRKCNCLRRNGYLSNSRCSAEASKVTWLAVFTYWKCCSLYRWAPIDEHSSHSCLTTSTHVYSTEFLSSHDSTPNYVDIPARSVKNLCKYEVGEHIIFCATRSLVVKLPVLKKWSKWRYSILQHMKHNGLSTKFQVCTL